jgi:hypothetical protein
MTLGIDLGTLHAVLDLQGGIEEADRMLGYRVERGPPALPGVPPPAGAVDREGTQP